MNIRDTGEGMDEIHLAQDTVQRGALLNMIMDFWFYKRWDIY